MGTKRQDIRTLSKRHPKLETLMYRVDKESLIRQHRLQKKDKAPGIDMVTKEVYQENLNENIVLIAKLIANTVFKLNCTHN